MDADIDQRFGVASKLRVVSMCPFAPMLGTHAAGGREQNGNANQTKDRFHIFSGLANSPEDRSGEIVG